MNKADSPSRLIDGRIKELDQEREQLRNAQGYKPGKHWTPYDRDFRSHYYLTYSDSNLPYESYVSAYCYGYQLARDERYETKHWRDIVTNVRRDWERHNGKAWVTVADAISYGFLKGCEHSARRARYS